MADATGYYNELTYASGNPFIDAKLKIKRAERHLHELENAARELPKRRPYHFVIGAKTEHGQIQIIYMPSNNMPLEFGTILGDAVHNIRAAFDYVSVVISCPPYGKAKPKDVHFPVGKDRQKFIKACKGKMKGAGPDALRIVEELEPYHGGKHSIHALHELDVKDKHKLLVPTASHLHVVELELVFGDKLVSLAGKDFLPNKDGSNFVATINCPGIDPEQFKRGEKFDAAFTIVFGKEQPFEGQPIIPTLSNLCSVAKSFIKTCETQFL